MGGRMTRWDQGQIFDQAGALIASLGGSDFDQSLITLLGSVAHFEQFIVFALAPDGEASCLQAWHRATPHLVAGLHRRYIEGQFQRIDPALGILRQARGRDGRGNRRNIHLLQRQDIADLSYKSHFFDQPDLAGKVAILEDCSPAPSHSPPSPSPPSLSPQRQRSETNGELYLNFYKRSGESGFSDQEIDNLASLSGLVGQSIRRHRLLSRPPTSSLPRLEEIRHLLCQDNSRKSATGGGGLTPRELDVCARVLVGYSSEAIALDLGIGESSVATYRKRAYGKLGISSQNELFALCLRAGRG